MSMELLAIVVLVFSLVDSGWNLVIKIRGTQDEKQKRL
jgi:uncharacterized membrane protein YfhO